MSSKQRANDKRAAKMALNKALTEIELFGCITSDTYRYMTSKVAKVVKTGAQWTEAGHGR
jgi:hypothetical protein